MRTALLVTMLATISVPVLTQTAFAQTSPGTAQPQSGMSSASVNAAVDPAMKSGMARVEQHIAQLHDRLGITPAQQPQWDSFAAVMRDNALRMERGYAERVSKIGNLSAIDDMKSYAAISHAHAENVDRLIPTFEALYGSMSPAQKAMADKTFQDFQRGPGNGKGRRHS